MTAVNLLRIWQWKQYLQHDSACDSRVLTPQTAQPTQPKLAQHPAFSVVCSADTNLAHDMSYVQHRSHHGLVQLLSAETHDFCLPSLPMDILQQGQ